ncbi:MAG TPA: glycosyltransferase family 4 protein, partial [Acidimicrobiia bacterium]|nr:glycosyltransferase family 4 protein [Acidimicrobiia bacterium]
MRIALVYDALYPDAKGGVEKRVWELASRLAARGNDVHLLGPRSWSGSSSLVRDGVTLRGVSRRRDLYTPRGRRALLPAVTHALGVWRLLRREHFDVVDCQIPAHLAALAAWAARRGASRLVVTWHEAWDRDWIEEMGFLGHGGRLVERIVARIPARHVAVSAHTASTLAAIGGPAAPVVPPGVYLSSIGPGDGAGEPSDILFVGRLVPTKNLGLLIDSVAALVSDGLEPKVAIVGDGPSRAEWESQTRRNGLQGHIEFRGALDAWSDVIAAIGSAKAVALPSIREGFGMVALEAAACGVPVVTVDHRRNASRHVVEDGVTGLCVPPDRHSFSSALRTLLGD